MRPFKVRLCIPLISYELKILLTATNLTPRITSGVMLSTIELGLKPAITEIDICNNSIIDNRSQISQF